MKKALNALLAIAAGVGVGGGSAYAVTTYGSDLSALRGPTHVFSPAGTMVAPLVFPDGRLAAYISFEAEFEIDSAQKELVDARLPVLMHAVNLRTYRTPLAAGIDGLIPELEGLRKLVAEAADETYGKGVVRRVVVTQAMPT